MYFPTPLIEASERQQKALFILPKVSSALSFVGSCYIVFDVIRIRRKRKKNSKNRRQSMVGSLRKVDSFRRNVSTYHAIVLGMSCFDLFASCAWFFTTWPIPYDVFPTYGAMGSQETCTTQGFFAQFSITVVIYNGALSLYYLLVIRYGWSERQIEKSRVEYFMHGLPVILGIGTSSICAAMGLFNPTKWACWIGSVPLNCIQSWSNGYSTCIRGDNADMYRWFFFYIPLWLVIVFATGAMSLIIRTFRTAESKLSKWSTDEEIQRAVMLRLAESSKRMIKNSFQRLMRTSTHTSSQHDDSNSGDENSSTRMSLSLESTKRLLKISFQRIATRASQREGSIRNSNDTILGNVNDANFDTSNHNTADTNSVRISETNNNDNNNNEDTESNRINNNNSINSHSTSNSSYNTTMNFNTTNSRASNNENGNTRMTPAAMLAARRASVTIMGRYKTRSRMVTTQAVLYAGSFYFVWLFPTILRIQEMITDGVTSYHWVLLSATFLPMQGFLNVIIYLRPIYLKRREEKKQKEALSPFESPQIQCPPTTAPPAPRQKRYHNQNQVSFQAKVTEPSAAESEKTNKISSFSLAATAEDAKDTSSQSEEIVFEKEVSASDDASHESNEVADSTSFHGDLTSSEMMLEGATVERTTAKMDNTTTNALSTSNHDNGKYEEGSTVSISQKSVIDDDTESDFEFVAPLPPVSNHSIESLDPLGNGSDHKPLEERPRHRSSKFTAIMSEPFFFSSGKSSSYSGSSERTLSIRQSLANLSSFVNELKEVVVSGDEGEGSPTLGVSQERVRERLFFSELKEYDSDDCTTSDMQEPLPPFNWLSREPTIPRTERSEETP